MKKFFTLITFAFMALCANAQDWTAEVDATWPAEGSEIPIVTVQDIIEYQRTFGVNIHFADNYCPEATSMTAGTPDDKASDVALYKKVGDDWTLCAYGKAYSASQVYPNIADGAGWSRMEGVSVGFPYSACKYELEINTEYKVELGTGVFYDAETGARSPEYTFTFSTAEEDANTYVLGTPKYTVVRNSETETVVTVELPDASTSNENAVLGLNPKTTDYAKILDDSYHGYSSTYDLVVADGKLTATFIGEPEHIIIEYNDADDTTGHEVKIPSSILVEGETYNFQMFSNVFGWIADGVLKDASDKAEFTHEFVASAVGATPAIIEVQSATVKYVTYAPSFGEADSSAIDPDPASNNQAYIMFSMGTDYTVNDADWQEAAEWGAVDAGDIVYAIYDGDNKVAEGTTSKKVSLNTDNGIEYGKTYTLKISSVTFTNYMTDDTFTVDLDLAYSFTTIDYVDDAVNTISVKKADGKYLDNGKLIIKKADKNYNAAGAELK